MRALLILALLAGLAGGAFFAWQQYNTDHAAADAEHDPELDALAAELEAMAEAPSAAPSDWELGQLKEIEASRDTTASTIRSLAQTYWSAYKTRAASSKDSTQWMTANRQMDSIQHNLPQQKSELSRLNKRVDNFRSKIGMDPESLQPNAEAISDQVKASLRIR